MADDNGLVPGDGGTGDFAFKDAAGDPLHGSNMY
jgi:hypothetical protein